MVKFVWINFLCLYLSHVAIAEDAYCYRDLDGNLTCFNSMEEVPELYRPQAFYKPSATKVNSLPISKTESNLSSQTSLPPAKSLEQETESETRSIKMDSAEKANLEIFVAKWCPHCKALEKFLKERSIHYTKYDVETDEYGAKIYEQEGTLPVSILNGKTILGFDQRQYGEILDAELPY